MIPYLTGIFHSTKHIADLFYIDKNASIIVRECVRNIMPSRSFYIFMSYRLLLIRISGMLLASGRINPCFRLTLTMPVKDSILSLLKHISIITNLPSYYHPDALYDL